MIQIASTCPLTTGIDNVRGGVGADTIIGQIGQTTTLQASDSITGGDGVDTLRVVTDGMPLAGVGGFKLTGVERLEVQSQAVGGTQLGLENAGSLTSISSSASTSDLTLQNVGNIVSLQVANSVNATNVSLNYTGAAIIGKADVQNVVLNNAKVDNLTVNGIESIAITTNAASTVNTLNTAASTVTLAGAAALTVTNALNAAVTKVDASAATGAVTVTLAEPLLANAAVTTSVTGGTGNDKLNVSANTGKLSLSSGAGDDTITATANLTKTDVIAGGDGKDTLVVAAQSITESNADSFLLGVKSIEVLSASTGTLAVELGAKAQASGINTITAATASAVDVSTAAAVNSVDQYTNALTVNLSTGADRVVNNANVGLTVNAAASAITAADTLTGGKGVDALVLTADGVAAGADLATVSKFETVTVKAHATDATLGAKVVLGANTLAADGSTTTPTASITVDASALGSKAVATIDGSANNTYETLVAIGGAGDDVLTGGAGNDVITAGAGNDAITIGAGKDSVNAGVGDDLITAASNLTAADSIDGGDGNDTLVVDSVASADLANVTNVENLQFSGDLTFNSNVAFTSFDLKAVAGANTLTLATGYTNATSLKLGANDRVINTTDAAITANVTETDLAGGAIVRSGKGVDTVNVTADAFAGAVTLTTTNLSKVDRLVVVDGGDALPPADKMLAGNGISFTVNSLDTALTIDGSALDAGTYAADTTKVDGRGAPENWENLVVNASGMTDPLAATTKAVSVVGGAGHDVLTGGAANDSLMGGAGDDQLAGNAGNNHMDGGAGNDQITGGSGNDVILGDDGDDAFIMTGVLTGEDMINGGAGNDSITVGHGASNLDFLNTFSVETLVLATSGSTTLGSYAQQAGIRNVTGTAGGDTLTATAYTDGLTVTPGTGNDTLKTSSGADVFVFSGTTELDAADVIDAGTGADTIRLDFGVKSNLVATNGTAAPVTVTLGVVQGVESIVVNDQAGKNENAAVTINFAASYGTDGAGKLGKASLITIDGSSLDYVKAADGTVTQETLTVNASANSGDDVLTTDVNEAEAC